MSVLTNVSLLNQPGMHVCMRYDVFVTTPSSDAGRDDNSGILLACEVKLST